MNNEPIAPVMIQEGLIQDRVYDFAKKYRRIGWNVIPLFGNSKNPALSNHLMPTYTENGVTKRGWKVLQTRMSTDEEFERWFRDPHISGLGLITGAVSDVLVVDEDSYKEGGKTFVLESNTMSRTANGGRHFFFKYNKDIATTGLQQGVFIEIKSEGGFVVLPPSQVTKKDGTLGQYYWERAESPLPLLKIDDVSDIKKHEETEKVVISELAGAELGEQHNNLRTIANSILFKYDPKDWERYAYQQIRQEAARFNPPHPPHRVERIIKDCSEFVLGKLQERESQKKSIKVFEGKSAMEEFNRIMEEQKGGIPTTFSELDRFFKLYPGHVYLFSGVSHVGKTIVVLNMAANIASLGHRVLYVSLEMGINIAGKVESIVGGEYPPTLTILTSDDFLTINSLKNFMDSKKGQYDVIFIDHLHFLGKVKKNPVDSMDYNIHSIQNLALKMNVPIVAITHLRKINENREPRMDDLKDSQALQGVPSVVVLIHRKENEVKEGAEFYERHSRVGTLLVDKNRLYNENNEFARHTGRIEYTLIKSRMSFDPGIISSTKIQEAKGERVSFSFTPKSEEVAKQAMLIFGSNP